jgi:hypothetical protein
MYWFLAIGVTTTYVVCLASDQVRQGSAADSAALTHAADSVGSTETEQALMIAEIVHWLWC